MDQFFKHNRIYAVVGASTKPEKFGFKVFKWYKDRGIPAVPINISREPVLGVPALGSVNELSIPTGYDVAVSIITPPSATEDLIESIKSVPVKAAWLQPGTHTARTVNMAQSKIPVVITDCILVNGDRFLSKL